MACASGYARPTASTRATGKSGPRCSAPVPETRYDDNRLARLSSRSSLISLVSLVSHLARLSSLVSHLARLSSLVSRLSSRSSRSSLVSRLSSLISLVSLVSPHASTVSLALLSDVSVLVFASCRCFVWPHLFFFYVSPVFSSPLLSPASPLQSAFYRRRGAKEDKEKVQAHANPAILTTVHPPPAALRRVSSRGQRVSQSS